MPGAEGRGRAVAVTAALAALAAILTALRLSDQLPPSLWWQGAVAPDLDDPGQLVFHFAGLPRLAVALLCGAALGLAGALLQQVLRNPLASPTTLGIEAGSQLAVTAAVIGAPALLAGGREVASLLGATAATALVFAGASARGLSSLSVILSGLVVGLFCVALSASLKLVNQEYASVLFLWGGGSLVQQDWSAPLFLLPRIALLGLAASLAVRPLSLLSLDDEGARSLGLPVTAARIGGIAIAVGLASTVTAAVGTIGFVGLAAPQIARFAGARRFATRLALAPAIGAALLAAVDAAVGAIAERTALSLPTGAATALLGAPLLVWLLPRLRLAALPSAGTELAPVPRQGRAPGLAWLAGAVLLAALLALSFGRTADGWSFVGPQEIGALLPWRLPRTLVALVAGGMLATAGLVLQRLTGNPIAGPEILGLGTGVAAGLSVAMLLSGSLDPATPVAAGAAGAFAVLAILFAVGARSRFAPEHLLLTGIALSALLDAFVVSFLALGDDRALQLLAFVSGSTYRADMSSAAATAALALALVPTVLLLRRWLDILPLGESAAGSLGVPVATARLALTALAAGLTAAAILVVGPLSFVGLMGPHAARLIGFRGAARQVLAAGLIGGGIMVAADWVGRVAIHPRQLPAGLVAALIGMPYLFWQLSRRRA